jgi:hypothetical protein
MIGWLNFRTMGCPTPTVRPLSGHKLVVTSFVGVSVVKLDATVAETPDLSAMAAAIW